MTVYIEMFRSGVGEMSVRADKILTVTQTRDPKESEIHVEGVHSPMRVRGARPDILALIDRALHPRGYAR